MKAETWAEQDLDRYLEAYAKGSEETERRRCICDFCGEAFDYKDGKIIETCAASNIKIRGNRPTELHICNYCLSTAYDIELED